MKKKTIITIITALGIICLAVGGYFLFSKSQNTLQDDIIYDEFSIKKGHHGEYLTYDKSLYIDDYKGNYDYAYYITGKVSNNSINNYKFVIISFDLFDQDNKKLGNAIAGINNMNSQDIKDFKAMSITTTEVAKKVVSYKINFIKGE